jgi:hypothetical protein
MQRFPSLHTNLAIGYYSTQNHAREALYLLHLCFMSDHVQCPSRVSPARICNLFLFTISLHKLAKDSSSTVPELSIQNFETMMVYKILHDESYERRSARCGKLSMHTVWCYLQSSIKVFSLIYLANYALQAISKLEVRKGILHILPHTPFNNQAREWNRTILSARLSSLLPNQFTT